MKENKKSKRRHVRVQAEPGMPVTVDINGENFVDVLSVHDISEGGLSVNVPHGFQGCRLEQPVELVVNLPDPIVSSFMATGKIKHISQKNFGVVFLAVSQKNLKVARRYVNHRIRHRSWWARMGARLKIYLAWNRTCLR